MKHVLSLRSYIKMLLLFCGLMATGLQAETIQYELVESTRSIMRTGPNQSLDLMVQQIYPNNESLWPQIKQKIRQINPHAFNRYSGRLMENQRLKLVTIKTIRQGEIRIDKQVGNVTSVKGLAVVTDKNGKDGSLKDNSVIYEGDRITTRQGAELVVRMVDGAEMRIKPDSSVRITEYEMKSGFDSGSRSIIDLIKGGLRKLTGSIGANPLSVYRFHTGVMTIGVRGTDYVLKLCEANDCEKSSSRNQQDARLHVVVLDGVITLEDEEGVQGELALGQYAVATADTKVFIDDAKPVKGLLNEEEQAIFDKTIPPEKESELWPWLLGGALLGL